MRFRFVGFVVINCLSKLSNVEVTQIIYLQFRINSRPETLVIKTELLDSAKVCSCGF